MVIQVCIRRTVAGPGLRNVKGALKLGPYYSCEKPVLRWPYTLDRGTSIGEQQFNDRSSGERPYTFKLSKLAIHDQLQRAKDGRSFGKHCAQNIPRKITRKMKISNMADFISDKSGLSLVG